MAELVFGSQDGKPGYSDGKQFWSADEFVKGTQDGVSGVMHKGANQFFPVKESNVIERGLGQRLLQRAKNVGTEFENLGKTAWTGKGDLVRPTLHVAGEAAGALGDVAGAAIEGGLNMLKPDVQPGQTARVGGLTVRPDSGKEQILNSRLGQEGLKAIQQGQKVYDLFKKSYPEVAKDLESVVNIAALYPVGRGAKAVAPEVGRMAGGAAGTIERNMADQARRDAIDVVRKDLRTYTKKEREIALKTSQVEKPGFMRRAQIKVTPYDEEIAKSVEDVVKKNANPVENIGTIKRKIARAEEPKTELLRASNAVVNPEDISQRLLKTKENSAVIFGSDKTLENAYDAVTGEFMKILEKKPKTLEGALQARKEFDEVIKQKFPKLFDQFEGDNIRANAVKDVRMAANDYIADSLPEGNQFKTYLREQNNMYRAIDRIAEKAAPALDASKLARLTSIMRKHPWLSVEAGGALAGIGVGATGLGGSLVSIVTNPVALGALAAYGTVRMGNAIVTSQQIKNALAGFLRQAERNLSREEVQAVQATIAGLDTVEKGKRLVATGKGGRLEASPVTPRKLSITERAYTGGQAAKRGSYMTEEEFKQAKARQAELKKRGRIPEAAE